MTAITSKLNPKTFHNYVWKMLFVIGILCFFTYGLSFFFAKPTVETVITPVPQVNVNTEQQSPQPQNVRQLHTRKSK